MKFFKYMFKMMFVALIVISCSDDNSTNSNDDSVKLGEMTATLDGKSFSSAQAQGIKIGNLSYQISGMNISGESISLMVYTTAPGTYSNGIGFVNIVPNFNPALQEVYNAQNVTYTIKEFEDNELEGTFAFTANQENGSKTKVVKNAKFKVKIVN